MPHSYRIILDAEELTVDHIQTFERNETEYLFLDDQNELVAVFDRLLIKAVIRTNSPGNQTNQKTEKEPNSVYTKPCENKTIHSLLKKELATPRNRDIPFETGVTPKTANINDNEPKRQINLQKNHETNAYEVHSKIIPNVAPSVMSNTTHVKQEERKKNDDDNLKIMSMVYKNVESQAIYDPKSKCVLLQKGQLIARNDSGSLINSKSLAGVRAKRRTILRKQSVPHNHDYNITTEDIEFSSLSQACRAITGTAISPTQYWKEINEKES